jgi:hypothetical protein
LASNINHTQFLDSSKIITKKEKEIKISLIHHRPFNNNNNNNNSIIIVIINLTTIVSLLIYLTFLEIT